MNKELNLVNNENSRSGYFVKRVFAFAFDWYISSVLLNFFIRLAIIWAGKGDASGDIVEYDNTVASLTIIISLIVSFIYYVIVPYKLKKSQTMMMKVVGLEIVDDNNNKADFKSLIKRFYIGCFLLQGILYSSFNHVLEAILKLLNVGNIKTVDYIVAIPMLIIIVISSYFSIKDKDGNKTLHDRISKTKVVEVI